MKFTVTIPVTVEVDIDIDNQIVNQEYVMQDLTYACDNAILNDDFCNGLVEAITEHTGYCVNGLNVSVEGVKDNEEVG